MHARLEPVEHRFRYPLYMYAFDLSELEQLDRETALFGYNRFRPVAVHDRDYLADGPGSILEKTCALLASRGVSKAPARVMMVSAARYFQHVFNPVTFYYCFNGENDLTSSIVEINNTYREKHVYVVPNPPPDGKWLARFRHGKEFHVSPYNDMQGEYEFHFSPIDEDLDIRVDLHRKGRAVLKAQLTGKALPFSAKNLWRTVVRHPISASLTMPRILFEAARLSWIRKLYFHAKPHPSSPMTIRVAPPTRKQRICTSIILKFLSRIECGRLTLVMPNGDTQSFGGDKPGTSATIRIRDYDFFWWSIKEGDVGFAEAYMAGIWETESLVDVLNCFMENDEQLAGNYGPLSGLGRFLNRIGHRLRRNTFVGSRRNIQAHYDLSNEFYQTFLDPTMTYSCGIFLKPEETLEDAQRNKLRLVIQKARITASDHVLEIGSGWGSFAIEAARATGCRVTTITLSEAQLQLTRQRIREAGLEDRIEVLLKDYRSMRGQFDRIVSIEMLEAVGHENYPVFFRTLQRLLRPNGLVVLQSITVPDDRYETYRKGCEFIQKHIFPGGILPSVTVLSQAMTRNSHFFIEHLENIGIHYARTLQEWRNRFLAAKDRVAQLGFDDEFQRKWEYYLVYCEVGFAHRFLNDVQMVLTRPKNRTLEA